MYIGILRGEGGLGGIQVEVGGFGIIYLYKFLLFDSSGKVLVGFIINRIFYVDNQNQGLRDFFRNFIFVYIRYNQSSVMIWLIFSGYFFFVFEIQLIIEIILDELQIYRQVQLVILNSSNFIQRINIFVVMIEGDRSGYLYVGFNQFLWIGSGQISNYLFLYYGVDIIFQGELRVVGVNVMVEGVVNNVENLIVVDGGIVNILNLIVYFSKYLFNEKVVFFK